MDYDRLADLPVTIDAVSTTRRTRETSSGFTRDTTTISFVGETEDGEVVTGSGEDVTYETDEHEALEEHGLPDLTGEFTVDSFSAHLEGLDLFPAGEPKQPAFRNYRRWGLESAALDLALRQAGTDLASALGRSFEPLRFVASTRLGEPPTTDRLDAFLARDSSLEFKLDPTLEWDAPLIEEVAALEAVRILDLKGQYEGTDVDVPADPVLYERIVEGFPDAVIEDPALTDETWAVLEGHEDRVSWDAPIHGVADVEALPWEPSWLNVKPSRFGSLESLLETLEYCAERGIRCYGGGQFELGVGREQIQAIASLYYADSPNDVAPRQYNDPEPDEGLPRSPLEPSAEPVGFGW